MSKAQKMQMLAVSICKFRGFNVKNERFIRITKFMVMTRIIIFFLLLNVGNQVIAQPRAKMYKLKITTKTGRVKSGYLREMTDSTLLISPQPLLESPVESIKNKSIQSITVRERHAIWKGVLIGAGTGAFIGGLIGYATYKEPVCYSFCLDFGPEADALGGGLIGGAAGALIGLAVGSSSKYIKLNQGTANNSFDGMYKFVITPSK